MITKGDKTRQFIIGKSEQLFSQRGYSGITMTDICNACHLSRGGLYRYFGSPKEVFLAVLNEEQEEAEHELRKCIENRIPPDWLFDYFLDQQKKLIIQQEGGMSIAIHDFAFTEPDYRDFMDKRYKTAVQLLSELFHYGQKEGCFKNANKEIMATHTIIFLEGLKISSTVMTITEEEVDKQLEFLREAILIF